jgi:hypothetical protein
VSIEIDEQVLKKACMEMIETIFVCLPNAFKGTIYRVGKMPDLVVERITSGIISDDNDEISWGLPAKSDYNPPGRSWLDYRDEPGRPLEAMSWCVERQKSWTAEDPTNDSRSVRLQYELGIEDFQHMEPVLVRKEDLNLDMYSSLDYPRNFDGDIIWEHNEFVVVAVVKIHFRPYTIKMNSHETRVIKKLSRSLGTELLSYQLRQDSMNAMQDLAKDRINACNILADSLRNAITKFGLILSLVRQEIGFLRIQWENNLLEERREKDLKREYIGTLDDLLVKMNTDLDDKELIESLSKAQRKFLNMSLPPEKGKKWIKLRIEEKWLRLLNGANKETRELVIKTINDLKKTLLFGQDPNIIGNYSGIPEKIRKEWIELIYSDMETFNIQVIDRLINILESDINIPSRERSSKVLRHLKALAETMSQLERNTNFLLHQVLNGNGLKAENNSIDESLHYIQ